MKININVGTKCDRNCFTGGFCGFFRARRPYRRSDAALCLQSAVTFLSQRDRHSGPDEVTFHHHHPHSDFTQTDRRVASYLWVERLSVCIKARRERLQRRYNRNLSVRQSPSHRRFLLAVRCCHPSNSLSLPLSVTARPLPVAPEWRLSSFSWFLSGWPVELMFDPGCRRRWPFYLPISFLHINSFNTRAQLQCLQQYCVIMCKNKFKFPD